MLSFAEYSQFFVGLLAIVDPLGAIPVFLILTARQSPKVKRATIRLTVLSVFSVLVVSMALGEIILNVLGISINAFRCAGGLVLLLMSLAMLQSHLMKPSEVNELEADETVALVPLTIPLLAGPGAISTVIVYAHQSNELSHWLLIFAAITSVCFCLWLTLVAMPWLSKHITAKSIAMSTRIMGLLLAAIAIEFIAGGLKGLFPSLAI
ncbi:MAG: NAAT family transporter [Gammaproteobacteria bacterium]|nr:MAG: NAAT family transporter [Gammaproteobacteria bacterium]